MPRVRYLGWVNRDPSGASGLVTSSQFKKSVHLPTGSRLIFRGRAGRPSQWRTVEEEDAEYLREQDEFEVEL